MANLQKTYAIEKGRNTAVYEFISVGPKGTIKKRVEFSLRREDPEVYNLALGDVNEMDEIDDEVITNNGDTAVVLATVAVCVTLFFEHHPHAAVIAAGNSPGRTRLYRMNISSQLKLAEENFEVQGFNKGWEKFTADIQYEAFLVKRKNL